MHTTPDLSHRAFLVLSVLMDGRAKRCVDVLQETHGERWTTIFTALDRLHATGLVTRQRALARNCERGCDGRVKGFATSLFQITDAGRQAWNECADWYCFLMGNFGKRQPRQTIGQLRILCRQPVTRSERGSPDERTPTAHEDEMILRHASPEFATIYQCIRRSQFTIEQLANLDVEQVDWQAGRLKLGQEAAPMPKDAVFRAALKRAIAGRKSGRVFLTPRGHQFDKGSVAAAFNRFRRKAGLPRSVKLRGHSRQSPRCRRHAARSAEGI